MSKCPLNECPYQGRTVVPYHGSKPADLLIVGEAPGQEEIRRGKPFVGMSGKVLDAVLEANGIERAHAYIANSCRCIIDKDKDSVKDQNAALRHCRRYLTAAVKKVQPKLIVTVGAFALRQVMGMQKIMANRGKFFDSEEFGCKVFCTVHPAFVLRGASGQFWKKPAARRTMKENLLFVDFEQVAKFLKNGDASSMNLEAYRQGTAADIKEINASKTVAVDFETTGLDLKNPSVKALSVSFTWKEGESAVFLARNGRFPTAINNILQNPKIQKIVAARPFEERVCLDCLGFKMGGKVHDVLEMAHLLDENSYSYSLEAVADIYTPLKGIKDLAEGMRGDLTKLSRDKLIKYNGADTDATLRAFNTMRKIMARDPQLLRYYASFMQKIQTMFAELSSFGCLVDTKVLGDDQKELTELVDRLHQECIDMIPESIKEKREHKGKLKLSRDSLVRDYLFNDKNGLRLTPIGAYITPKTKQPQASEDHLAFFPGIPFIEKYVEMRRANKILRTYHKNYWKAMKEDNRIYPTTLLNATVTGRTVMKNPTIQTIPQRGNFAPYAKRCFVADPGWLMGARDLGQSEIRIMGWLARDPNILGALEKNIDIHLATAAMVNGLTVEQFKKLPKKEQKLKRQQAKGVNFGFLYGMGAKNFRVYARESYGLDFTEAECEEIRDRFFSKPKGYWRLPVFHRKQEKLSTLHGYVKSPLGRIRRLPDARSEEWKLRGNAWRQGINFPVQSFSSDLGLIGMYCFWLALKKNERGLRDKVKVMWFIHDSVIFQAKRSAMPKAMALLKECMEVRAKAYVKQKFGLEIGYPITSDGKRGPNWQDMEEDDD